MKLGRAVTWREADRVADVARVMFGLWGSFTFDRLRRLNSCGGMSPNWG